MPGGVWQRDQQIWEANPSGWDTHPTPAATRSYHAAELAADRVIHLIGIVGGAGAAILLLAMAAIAADGRSFAAVLVYAGALLTMLGCSAAYNLSASSPRRELLRRLDHAAIFLMIAGTYTPFTACLLSGDPAVWYTAGVWGAALAGAITKLLYPRLLQRLSILLYLALGWMLLLVGQPLLGALDRPTLTLIAAGGILYSVGAGIHVWNALRFQNAIWHGFVLLAACFHYAAILHGVVLAGSRS